MRTKDLVVLLVLLAAMLQTMSAQSARGKADKSATQGKSSQSKDVQNKDAQAQSKDAAKGKILANFLNWMVDDGQKMTADLTYAPLPENVAEKVKGAIKMVQ